MTRAAPSEFTVTAWPALLTTELACAYTQLSERSFRLFAAKYGVSPTDCGGLAVTRWRRSDLDRLIDSLPAKGEQSPHDEPAGGRDPAELALEKAKRRARGH